MDWEDGEQAHLEDRVSVDESVNEEYSLEEEIFGGVSN